MFYCLSCIIWRHVINKALPVEFEQSILTIDGVHPMLLHVFLKSIAVGGFGGWGLETFHRYTI
jgi:hypothetical protein